MSSASKKNWRMYALRVLFLLAIPPFLPQSAAAQIKAVVPSSAPAPIGPYTPGINAGDYLYVSGQGARSPNSTMPAAFEDQVRQTLENVKAVVEADGLTMEHIVYMQVYLEDIGKFGEMNRVYAEYFPKSLPARATLGVAKLPGTPVEINAVAIRNLSHKKVISVEGYDPREPVSPGVLTHDRLFISAMRGRELSTGKVPEDPTAQVELALEGVKAVVEAAGLNMSHIVFVNPYLTGQIPMQLMNQSYAKRFEFGNTPARATIRVAALPEGAQIEFTGVAVRELKQRLAVRPKNMPPSPTASPCVFAGNTFYCSAKSGFIPGPNGGIFTSSVENQLRQTMRNLLDNLEEAGLDFSQVVATNVYLDDLGEFQAMNGIYAKYFAKLPPARTTVQPHASVERKISDEGQSPSLEEISIIAIKPEGK
jgi:2-iminobutanoate/2-iminopropanoate deaminase